MADYDLPVSADVKAVAPEFADADDARVSAFIDLASTFVGRNSWEPDDYRLGIIYLTAHFLTMAPDNATTASGGIDDANLYIRSITIKDRTVSFGQRVAQSGGGGTGTDLNATWYGQMYLSLRNRNAPKVAVV